jgi:hypothetical protein
MTKSFLNSHYTGLDKNYAKALLSAADKPAEESVNFVLELPKWYDDDKFKRCR